MERRHRGRDSNQRSAAKPQGDWLQRSVRIDVELRSRFTGRLAVALLPLVSDSRWPSGTAYMPAAEDSTKIRSGHRLPGDPSVQHRGDRPEGPARFLWLGPTQPQ